ncbi:uncharacterized protein [Temnothorax longispinosus]|uniref:uncharacterized protein n=1 Tax=Temnothorax longispinosus TaxID=300112 RepID=UPI003A993F62
MEELVEFPVLVDDELLTLVVNKETASRPSGDNNFLAQLVQDVKNKEPSTLQPDENCDTNNLKDSDDLGKNFSWPDSAVFLLIDLYREKEEEFLLGFKRHNTLWAEIATMMKQTNHKYNLSGLQCSNKWSGLKRTYKNISDQNKRSGNCRNSWAFFSVMDSIFGKKACTKPLSEASSDGPEPPVPTASTSNAMSSGSLSPACEVQSKYTYDL